MAREKLSLETIGELDGGRSAGIINAALKAAVADLDDRGEDGKPREVNIKLKLLKKKGNIFISAQAKTNMPAYQTDDTVGELRQTKSGIAIEFQPLAPENPQQEPLPKMSHAE
jgi:hypothetical protein